jgi:DNA sulfur modification protein DndE
VLPNRFRITKSASDAVKLMKARTGVTPNLLCRLAITLSLERGTVGGGRDVELDGLEFNSHTLFGDDVQIYEAFVRQVHGTLDPRECVRVIASHVDYGLDELKKCKSLLELSEFVASRA